MSARYIVGDVRDVLATIPDGSIDLVLTSPPFLALRSYLPADHPDKHREIGSEPDPATFIDTLLALTAEWRRVLAPHGSICVELGDTYSGSGSGGGDYVEGSGEIDMQRGQDFQRRRYTSAWPDAKSLCMIPELYRVALAYGRNPLTGEPSPAGRWRCRNVVRWHRPNPPVGALGDKFRPSTSDMVIACTSGKRYFDLDAVRTALKKPDAYYVREDEQYDSLSSRGSLGPYDARDSAGAPPLDTWVIPTAPYAGSHYATFPPALVERPVKSMVPLKVCRTCGEPSRRISAALTLDSYRASTRVQTRKAVALADEHGLTDEHIAAVRAFGTSDAGKAVSLNDGAGKNTDKVKALAAEAKAVLGGYFREFVMSTEVTRDSSWTDCGHGDDWRSGVVLDPFAGSGTTLMVATGHGRDAIGCDIDERNAELALERVGPLLLTVEHLADGDDRAAS